MSFSLFCFSEGAAAAGAAAEGAAAGAAGAGVTDGIYYNTYAIL